MAGYDDYKTEAPEDQDERLWTHGRPRPHATLDAHLEQIAQTDLERAAADRQIEQRMADRLAGHDPEEAA